VHGGFGRHRELTSTTAAFVQSWPCRVPREQPGFQSSTVRTDPALGPNDFFQILATGSLIWKLLAKLIEIHGHTPFWGVCFIKFVSG
jgi:hypothetical protein